MAAYLAAYLAVYLAAYLAVYVVVYLAAPLRGLTRLRSPRAMVRATQVLAVFFSAGTATHMTEQIGYWCAPSIH